jgi:hypothetical protein
LLGKRHTIDFSPLKQADRLEVLSHKGETIKTITDPVLISAAAEFIQRFTSGWKDPLSGPVVPDFMLHFYAGERGIGGYGIGVGVIVSNPPTHGFWSRSAPEKEVNDLAARLGIKLGGT